MGEKIIGLSSRDKSKLTLLPKPLDPQFMWRCVTCGEKFVSKENLLDHRSIHNACDICGKPFSSFEERRKHERKTHPIEERLTCGVCGRRFPCRSQLVHHRHLHAAEKPFICGYCGKKFPTAVYLKKHETYSHTFPYTCDICGDTFSHKGKLSKHLKIHSKGCNEESVGEASNQFICVFCDKKCSQYSNLKAHLLIHTGEKPYSCDLCGKSFRGNNSLTFHLKTHSDRKPNFKYLTKCVGPISYYNPTNETSNWHNTTTDNTNQVNTSQPQRASDEEHLFDEISLQPNEKFYTCHICRGAYNGLLAFCRHLSTHSVDKLDIHNFIKSQLGEPMQQNNDVNSIQNDNSDSLFNAETVNELNQSSSDSLMDKTDYVCTFCRKKFTDKSEYLEHLLKEGYKKLFTCVICEKKFTGKDMLIRHQGTHRSDTLTCEICGKEFWTVVAHKRHCKNHSVGKQFSCDVCGRAFKHKRNLLSHHCSEKKPYTCNFCGKKFSYLSSLKRHYFLIHSGKKQYSCDICGKHARAKKDLTKHMKIHGTNFSKDVTTRSNEYYNLVVKSEESEMSDLDQQNYSSSTIENVDCKTEITLHSISSLSNEKTDTVQDHFNSLIKKETMDESSHVDQFYFEKQNDLSSPIKSDKNYKIFRFTE